jgi:hypothetical protein
MGAGIAPATDAPQSESSFDQVLRSYLRSYSSGSALQRALWLSRIKRRVFSQAGSEEYVRELRVIDSASRLAPEAIYDLAKSLQLHWEASYAPQLGEVYSRRARAGTEIGAMVGMAALGAAMIARPLNAPRYFRVVRQLLPLAGAASGYSSAELLNHSGFFERNLPVAPAHVMHLGLSSDESHYDDQSLTRDILALTASVAAGTIAYDALKVVQATVWLNRAATPLKLNLLVLAGSLVVSYAVEKGVEKAVDQHELSRFRRALTQARARLDQDLAREDDAASYSDADALVAAAGNLARYMDRPLLDAFRAYTEDVAKASKRYGEETPRFERKLDQLTQDLSETVRKIRDREIHHLGGDYDQWVERYLVHVNHKTDAQLASELRHNRIPLNSNYCLMQAAALLRTTGKAYLSEQVDVLATQISRNLLLTRSAISEEAMP